jgi:hypothetical protein
MSWPPHSWRRGTRSRQGGEGRRRPGAGQTEPVYRPRRRGHGRQPGTRGQGQDLAGIKATVRTYRTIRIQVGQHVLTAADPIPDELHQALEAVNRARGSLHYRNFAQEIPGVWMSEAASD